MEIKNTNVTLMNIDVKIYNIKIAFLQYCDVSPDRYFIGIWPFYFNIST